MFLANFDHNIPLVQTQQWAASWPRPAAEAPGWGDLAKLTLQPDHPTLTLAGEGELFIGGHVGSRLAEAQTEINDDFTTLFLRLKCFNNSAHFSLQHHYRFRGHLIRTLSQSIVSPLMDFDVAEIKGAA